MVRNGIPTQELRKVIWQKLAGSINLPKSYSPDMYKKLVQLDNDSCTPLIIRDVHRTYPHYKFFAEKNGKGYVKFIL